MIDAIKVLINVQLLQILLGSNLENTLTEDHCQSFLKAIYKLKAILAVDCQKTNCLFLVETYKT